MDFGSLKGKLLVANPALRDSNFHRTVVLMLEHTESGALGVVLNRPGELSVHESLARWEPMAASPAVLFVGGPVEPSAAICLAEVAGAVDPVRWRPIPIGLDNLGTLDLETDSDDLAGIVRRLRVFAGYAGWAPGQLEAEIEAGGWFVVRPRLEDVFAPGPTGLWRAVLRRQGGSLASLAVYPDNPAVN